MEYNILELQEKLKEVLPSKRYQHTLGVQYTAACLAMNYGADIKLAELAGLLHDCAKYMSDDELLKKCRRFEIPIKEIEEKNAYLLHSKLGALFAKTIYHIDNDEVASAITYHTTGKPDMSDLEKIIFIADYIEPNRKIIPGLTEIRKIAFQDLDEAMYLILEHTLNYLGEEKGKKEIDNMTVEAYEYYKNRVKKEKKE
jgi:putative HD superfamily hydrolase of NAD metabolism